MVRNWAAALLALIATPALAQQPALGVGDAAITDRAQAHDAALLADARAFALVRSIPLGEALARLRAQEETVAITDALAIAYQDRLAGISIEHAPVYRIVVLLTGDAAVPTQTVTAGGMSVPIAFRTGAPATRAEILEAIERHQADLRAALPHPPGMGVDPRTGMLVVLVNPRDLAGAPADVLAAQLSEIAGVPVRVATMDQPQQDFGIEGGGRLLGTDPTDGRRYLCTTGFVVTDGMQSGIVTAAHCQDQMDYVDADRRATPLAFAGQWGWGYQDVQLHLSDLPLAPTFRADPAAPARTVTGWRNRASTRAGDIVCHRGQRTGYSCAEVEFTDFAPAGDLCGGACLPTWVTVQGPGCKGGDSGGPVFAGTTAFGILKGGSYRADGSCAFYYYMSTDYLPEGWTLAWR